MTSKKEDGKSVVEEMATEIARLAQKRVVEVDRVRFTCGPVTLKMVKATTGLGWLLNDRVLYDLNQCGASQVASAFYYNIKVSAQAENYHFCVRFGDTETVVWRVHYSNVASEMKTPLNELTAILKNPPTLID